MIGWARVPTDWSLFEMLIVKRQQKEYSLWSLPIYQCLLPPKDPAQLNAALVIHLPLPIYNVRGASLH